MARSLDRCLREGTAKLTPSMESLSEMKAICDEVRGNGVESRGTSEHTSASRLTVVSLAEADAAVCSFDLVAWIVDVQALSLEWIRRVSGREDVPETRRVQSSGESGGRGAGVRLK